MCARGDSVVLELPEWWRDIGRTDSSVSIDRCISHAVPELWKAGIVTLGCCCGHRDPALNGGRASVIINEGESPDRARDILRAADARDWVILKWRLVEA